MIYLGILSLILQLHVNIEWKRIIKECVKVDFGRRMSW